MNTETPNPGIPIDSPGNPSVSSVPSVVNQNTRSTRGLSRLAGLSDRQLQHINTWLDDAVPYREIVELCRTEFQVEIPQTTIQRYNKRSTARTLIDDLADSKEAAAEISKYAATGDARFSTNTLEILEQQAFDLAVAFTRDADAGDLSTLAKLWTLIHKAKNTAIRERHATVQEQKCALRARELELKSARLSPTPNLSENPTNDVAQACARSAQSYLLFCSPVCSPSSSPSQDNKTPNNSDTAPETPLTTHPLPLATHHFPSLPPEVIEANLRYAEKVRTGKIIIDRSGPWIRAIELPDADKTSKTSEAPAL